LAARGLALVVCKPALRLIGVFGNDERLMLIAVLFTTLRCCSAMCVVCALS
jgi:hypothetical protein